MTAGACRTAEPHAATSGSRVSPTRCIVVRRSIGAPKSHAKRGSAHRKSPPVSGGSVWFEIQLASGRGGLDLQQVARKAEYLALWIRLQTQQFQLVVRRTSS